MPIQKDQLRALITDVLKFAKLYSESAVELLMMTAAQETHCGDYIEQVNGPALGIFQMEPATHNDILKNYLAYKQSLNEMVDKFVAHDQSWRMNLRANLPYQIIMARVHYLRKSEPLPDYNDIDALAKYYKEHWNTYLGKATVSETKNNYMRYAV